MKLRPIKTPEGRRYRLYDVCKELGIQFNLKRVLKVLTLPEDIIQAVNKENRKLYDVRVSDKCIAIMLLKLEEEGQPYAKNLLAEERLFIQSRKEYNAKYQASK
jgi:hypothetical protein